MKGKRAITTRSVGSPNRSGNLTAIFKAIWLKCCFKKTFKVHFLPFPAARGWGQRQENIILNLVAGLLRFLSVSQVSIFKSSHLDCFPLSEYNLISPHPLKDRETVAAGEVWLWCRRLFQEVLHSYHLTLLVVRKAAQVEESLSANVHRCVLFV